MQRPRGKDLSRKGYGEIGTDLESILLLDGMYRGCKLSELGECCSTVWMGRAAMAGTGGVLSGKIDETEDGTPRRGGHRRRLSAGCHVVKVPPYRRVLSSTATPSTTVAALFHRCRSFF